MRPFKSITIIMAFVLILAYGCYPGGPSTTDDYTIVRTQYNTGYDFGSQKTFYMPDSMLFVSNIDGDNIDEDKLADYEAELLSSIQENMELRGYTLEKTDTNNMDLVILPSAVLAKNTSATWWPGGGWYGGYYPGGGWGWGGGWYYPPGYGGGYWSVTSYTTGTVFITIADYDSYDPTDEQVIVEIEWDALIDGLFNGVDISKIDRLVTQAFEQSPYLMSN